MAQNVADGTKTLKEFQDKFGADSCIFLKCDVADSDQFRGENYRILKMFCGCCGDGLCVKLLLCSQVAMTRLPSEWARCPSW